METSQTYNPFSAHPPHTFFSFKTGKWINTNSDATLHAAVFLSVASEDEVLFTNSRNEVMIARRVPSGLPGGFEAEMHALTMTQATWLIELTHTNLRKSAAEAHRRQELHRINSALRAGTTLGAIIIKNGLNLSDAVKGN